MSDPSITTELLIESEQKEPSKKCRKYIQTLLVLVVTGGAMIGIIFLLDKFNAIPYLSGIKNQCTGWRDEPNDYINCGINFQTLCKENNCTRCLTDVDIIQCMPMKFAEDREKRGQYAVGFTAFLLIFICVLVCFVQSIIQIKNMCSR